MGCQSLILPGRSFCRVAHSAADWEQQLSAGTLPTGSTLPTVLFDSWDPRLSPTLFYSVVLPYTYYADSTNRLCDFRILEFISFLGFCFLPTHGCSAVATGKYPPNTIPNKYFCIKMSHFDYDKHYID